MQHSTRHSSTLTAATSRGSLEAACVSAEAEAADRRLTQRLLVDLLIFVVLIIPIIIFEFGIEPFHRGFFCDDQTIRYPFQPNTVTPVMLGLLAGLLPLVIFITVEFIRSYRSSQLQDAKYFLGWQVPKWLLECFRQMFYFCFGMLLTFDATEVGKYTIGRLRPHFMAVCQPHFFDGTNCNDAQNQHRYVLDYACAAHGYTAEDVRQARLSFPSGHSSLGFYALVYVALYLQRRLTWRGSNLARHFAQFLLIMLAWFTALSRIMDHWHHWSDVLSGSLIGILGALLTARYIAKIFYLPPLSSVGRIGLKLGIPRQDTTTTLQDDISTPPPYTVNSFSNEQYCTKV